MKQRRPKLPPQTVLNPKKVEETEEEPKAPEHDPATCAWCKRVNAAMQAVRDKLARQAREFGDPVKPPLDKASLMDDTMIEGKTIAEWDEIDNESWESPLPGWASWAVRHWRNAGRPTRGAQLREQYRDFFDKAKYQEQKAQECDAEAKDFIEQSKLLTGKLKQKKGLIAKAAKKTQSAEKHRQKAAALLEEAEKFRQEHKLLT